MASITRNNPLRIVKVDHVIDLAASFEFDGLPDDANVYYEISTDAGANFDVFDRGGFSQLQVYDDLNGCFIRAVAEYGETVLRSDYVMLVIMPSVEELQVLTDEAFADMTGIPVGVNPWLHSNDQYPSGKRSSFEAVEPDVLISDGGNYADLADEFPRRLEELDDWKSHGFGDEAFEEFPRELEKFGDLKTHGFWVHNERGQPVHINGDPDMAPETVDAILAALEAITADMCFHTGIKENTDNMIQRGRYGIYAYEVWRCPKCNVAYVEIAAQAKPDLILTTVPTRIDLYDTANYESGYAYHWRFQGLNHSTQRIKGLQPKQAQVNGCPVAVEVVTGLCEPIDWGVGDEHSDQ